MGAFCVYGVSLLNCKKVAEKKVSHVIKIDGETIILKPVEWAVRRDEFANQLFDSAERRRQISPEFDSPDFCFDWLKIASKRDIKLAKIMVRGPKVDKNGNPVKKNGHQVMTWLEYSTQPVDERATEPA